MAGLLADLQASIDSALVGELSPATLVRQLPGEDDGYGNTLPGASETYGFEGLRGSYDAAYAGLGGIPRTSAKIEILASSLAVEPSNSDRVYIDGSWWVVVQVDVDPAGAWFTCQCIDSEAPE